MSLWDSLFDQLRQPIAQILLTRNDIADRSQYLNAVNTLNELLEMGVIPIVNENDTLAVAEIKFGDNDTLSAITAAMIHADFLFLMTDVDCLYDKNPRAFPDAKPIEVVEDISALQADVSSAGSSVGTGGMATKIVAARLASSAGVTTIITRSSNPGNIFNIVEYIQSSSPSFQRNLSLSNLTSLASALPSVSSILNGESTPATSSAPTPVKAPLHTRFLPSNRPIRDRHFWLLHGLAPHGTLYIDRGAHLALINKAGLLPVGVIGVDGTFAQQEAVKLSVVERDLYAPDGWKGTPQEVGRALVNYSAGEIARIKGKQSTQIQELLGYADSEYVALRENISLEVKKLLPKTNAASLASEDTPGVNTPLSEPVGGAGTPREEDPLPPLAS
jgi:glutamate 5-kinase